VISQRKQHEADLAYWQELADAVPGWRVMGWTAQHGVTFITTPGQWGPEHPDTVSMTGAQRDAILAAIRKGAHVKHRHVTTPCHLYELTPDGMYDPRVQKVVDAWRAMERPDDLTPDGLIVLLERAGVKPSEYHLRGLTPTA
jgi:hypothetical protein